jgi:hypothetical protein
MSSYNFQPLQNVMNNWARELPDEPNFTFDVDAEPNNITMISAGKEMLRVAEDGFYVRGEKVPADDREAATVYNAFKEFLVWSRLSRE